MFAGVEKFSGNGQIVVGGILPSCGRVGCVEILIIVVFIEFEGRSVRLEKLLANRFI